AQGLEGCYVGIGILAEELATAGLESDQAALSNEQQALRDAYVAQFGDWPEFCELWLRADPGYFAAMLDLLAMGRQAGGLEERSGGHRGTDGAGLFPSAARDRAGRHRTRRDAGRREADRRTAGLAELGHEGSRVGHGFGDAVCTAAASTRVRRRTVRADHGVE